MDMYTHNSINVILNIPRYSSKYMVLLLILLNLINHPSFYKVQYKFVYLEFWYSLVSFLKLLLFLEFYVLHCFKLQNDTIPGHCRRLFTICCKMTFFGT